MRALLRRAATGWDLHHVWALVGVEPPGWAEQIWRYQQLAFVACVVPAAGLAALCETAGGVMTLGGLSASIAGPIGPANWTRHPSFARHDRWQLPWPVTDYRISVADSGSRQLPHEMLVAEGCPSFPEAQSAWRAFCEKDFSLAGAQAPPQELALLRFARLDAWIGGARRRRTRSRVTVMDYQVDGQTILVMEVAPGIQPPYGLAVDKGSRDKPEFYVRRGSSTYPAQPGKLRLAARSRPPADGTSHRRTPFGPW